MVGYDIDITFKIYKYRTSTFKKMLTFLTQCLEKKYFIQLYLNC